MENTTEKSPIEELRSNIQRAAAEMSEEIARLKRIRAGVSDELARQRKNLGQAKMVLEAITALEEKQQGAAEATEGAQGPEGVVGNTDTPEQAEFDFVKTLIDLATTNDGVSVILRY
jgi:DNA repair exonuclease SbcCD ATPase subunit